MFTFFQVRLTDALVSGLNFSKAKGETEVAWVDAMIAARNQICQDAVVDAEDNTEQILTLEPLSLNEVSLLEILF